MIYLFFVINKLVNFFTIHFFRIKKEKKITQKKFKTIIVKLLVQSPE